MEFYAYDKWWETENTEKYKATWCIHAYIKAMLVSPDAEAKHGVMMLLLLYICVHLLAKYHSTGFYQTLSILVTSISK